MTVTFKKIEDGIWRASLLNASHVGGLGNTPQEALGWLCLNHPQRMGIGEFWWKDRPPKLNVPSAEQYPMGIVESFDTEASGS